MSGIPLFGSLLVVIACAISFGAIGTAVSAIVTVIMDTGGLPWFLFATWSDSSFWDADDVRFW